MAECTTTDQEVRVELTAADIPGAELGKPLEGHGVPAYKSYLYLGSYCTLISTEVCSKSLGA